MMYTPKPVLACHSRADAYGNTGCLVAETLCRMTNYKLLS